MLLHLNGNTMQSNFGLLILFIIVLMSHYQQVFHGEAIYQSSLKYTDMLHKYNAVHFEETGCSLNSYSQAFSCLIFVVVKCLMHSRAKRTIRQYKTFHNNSTPDDIF